MGGKSPVWLLNFAPVGSGNAQQLLQCGRPIIFLHKTLFLLFYPSFLRFLCKVLFLHLISVFPVKGSGGVCRN